MSEYLTRERNLTMLTDYYEYSMINGYFHAGIQDKIAVFDAVSYTHLTLPTIVPV